MRILLTVIFTILIASMLFSLIKIHKHNDEYRLNLTLMLIINIVLCLMQILFMYSSNESVSDVLTGIYTAAIYWYLVSLAVFVMHYTAVCNYFSQLQIIFTVFGLLDSALLLTNDIHHLVLKFEPVQVWDMDIFRIINTSMIFKVHVIACALLSVFCIFALGRKFFYAKGPFTRGKFAPVFIITTVAVIFALIVMLFNFYIDFSVIFYSILVNAICVLVYAIVPYLIRSQARAMVVQNSRSAVFFFDNERKKIYTNSSAATLETSIDISPLLNKYLSDISTGNLNLIHHSEVPLVNSSVSRLFNILCYRIVEEDEVAGYSLQFTDVTDEVQQRKNAIHKMTHDELTGLYNESYFCRQVENFVAESQAESYYMVVSDIMGFKFYNYIFGRRNGDKVLLYLANMLSSMTNGHSVYGRLGDDEYALFIEDKYFSEQVIRDCVSNMREQFSNPRYKININAGIYHVTDPNMSAELMCDRAKLAISPIRDDYNNIIGYYDSKISDDILAKQWVLDELETALSNHQFVMFLQPQVDSDTGRWIGGEALVRWVHPERGIVSPGIFIPILEEAAVITQVDLQIWEQAAQTLAQWKAAGHDDIYISVNVSGHDFFHANLYEVFTGLVEKYDISPKNLKIEVTETVLAYSREHKNTILSQLRNAGFTIEVDDFGSGYSSLNFLKDMESDVIKIDMGFLRRSENSERSRIIFNDVVSMIKDINMDIIVEGVETAEQLDFVRSTGCKYIQGYYYSRPISVDVFESRMKNVRIK